MLLLPFLPLFFHMALADETNINKDGVALDVSKHCPGVAYLWNQNSSAPMQQVSVSDCRRLPRQTAPQEVVYGFCGESSSFCVLRMQVPQGMYVHLSVQRLMYECDSKQWTTRIGREFVTGCSRHSLAQMFIELDTNSVEIVHINDPKVEINVKAVSSHRVITEYHQEHSGYLTVPQLTFASRVTHNTELKALSTSAMVVSVEQSYNIPPPGSTPSRIQVTSRKSDAAQPTVHTMAAQLSTPLSVFLAARLQISFTYNHDGHPFLKMRFSILSESDGPQKQPSGLLNCSVHQYSKFQAHVHCNLKTECEDGRDETEHCPFSSPGCQGLVASTNKCYQFIQLQKLIDQTLLRLQCLSRNARLASIKNRKEKQDALHIFRNYFQFEVGIGYETGWSSVPFMYSKFGKWSDSTMAYVMTHLTSDISAPPSRTVRSKVLTSMTLGRSRHRYLPSVLCEVSVFNGGPHASIAQSPPHLSTWNDMSSTRQSLLTSPQGYLAHSFLLCDASLVGEKARDLQVSSMQNAGDLHNVTPRPCNRLKSMNTRFTCDDGIVTVPYSQLCDLRQHCPDNSDESFCEQSSCHQFLCSNGQCALFSQRCNEHSDCLDDSDEVGCPSGSRFSRSHPVAGDPSRLLINLDATGYFTWQTMEADQSCPYTHYRCTTEWLYCLPVYTRCNGFSDCVNGEDEQDCMRWTCPGFYRCQQSSMCVHGDHLCDGWGQCPQRDDELMCDRTCPGGCLCKGDSFLCHRPIFAGWFPELRSMDATRSGMSLSDFAHNYYLISLTLASCSLVSIGAGRLYNLLYLDLSNNTITTLHMAELFAFPSLRTLLLANNPVEEVGNDQLKRSNYALRRIDVSQTHHDVVNNILLVYLPSVEHLNASFSDIKSIGTKGFVNLPHLRVLDLTGNPVNDFPLNALSRSFHLKRLLSSNYRLCCESLLPRFSDKLQCVTPPQPLPSCDTLIPTEMARNFTWLVAIFAILGNFICFAVSCTRGRKFGSSFLVASCHLQFANILMGCHAGIIVVADKLFDGKYMNVGNQWSRSVPCKVSGFLFSASSEVSVFIVCFITMNRVLVLWCPVRQSKTSTSVACCAAWLLGLAMSGVPFLPGLSRWGLEDQSGLCRLALFRHNHSWKDFKWFKALAIINCTSCFVALVFLVLACRRPPESSSGELIPVRPSVCSSLRDVMGKVAVTNAACWMPLGVVTMMTSAGVRSVDEVYNAMVVFVLPLTSAFYPVLFMVTVLTHRRQDEKLLKS